MAAGRTSPRVRVRRESPNKSSRNGQRIRAIVVHSTQGPNREGLGDLVALGGWGANPAADVSWHVATDGEGNSLRSVRDQDKAWHSAAYNGQTLGIEQVGFAEQKSWPEAQVRETARWIAYWSKRHGIPIQRGAVSNGVVTRPGVLTHKQLGAAGGGHVDPGAAFPLDRVLRLARQFAR